MASPVSYPSKPDQDWPWYVKAYYSEGHPRHPGEEAFVSRHRSEVSRDMEVKAARARPEIGRIETGRRFLIDLNPKSPKK